MLRRLLVPLDGSDLAEAALGEAVCLAVPLGAGITLLHLVEAHAPHAVHDHRHLTQAGEAHEYLDTVAAKLPATIPVEKHVHENQVQDVAQSIVDHVEELKPDLVVMCTHGRTDIRRLLYGSLAQQVVASGTVPVLMAPLGHTLCLSPAGARTILMPLDGQKAHEEGIPLVAHLARAVGARLHLLTVVHTVRNLPGERAATASMLPATMNAMLEMETENAQAYLTELAARLGAQALSVTHSVVRGKRVEEILSAATVLSADLIVLATHGKKGTQAFWNASVAPRVLEKSPIPVLLIPAK